MHWPCGACHKEVEFGFQIACDKCTKWFHGDCVGQFRKRISKWYCPLCTGHWSGRWQKKCIKKLCPEVAPIAEPCGISESCASRKHIASSPKADFAHGKLSPVKKFPQKMVTTLSTISESSGDHSSVTSSPCLLPLSPLKNRELVGKLLVATKNLFPEPECSKSCIPSASSTQPLLPFSPLKSRELVGKQLAATKKLFPEPECSKSCIPSASSTQPLPPLSPFKNRDSFLPSSRILFEESSEKCNPPTIREKKKSLKLKHIEPLLPLSPLKNRDFATQKIPSATRLFQESSENCNPATMRKNEEALSLKHKNKISVANVTPVHENTMSKNSDCNSDDVDLSDDYLSDDFIQPKEKLSVPAGTKTTLKKSNVSPRVNEKQQGAEWNVQGVDAVALTYLQTLLPLGFDHKITAVQPFQLGSKSLTAVIRLPLHSADEAFEWMTDFQSVSLSDYRSLKTFPNLKKNKVLFKKQFRCHHNTYPKNIKKHHKKHVQCTAQVLITLKNANMQKSKDPLLKTHPLEVRLRHWHNHPIESADVLRFRRPTGATKEIFMEYFKRGHTPSSALNCHKFEIQTKSGALFYKDHADGSKCPDLHWCYYQYYKIFKKVYGDNFGVGMMSKLKESIEEYNTKNGSQCANLYHEGDDIVIALCTPLMKRVHKHLKNSGELVQLDFSGGMDRSATRVGFLVTPSLAGGLPCGVILTTSETSSLITKGLQMLQDLYPEGEAFFGRGQDGPKVMLTDDAKNERISVKFHFPLVILLLCLFHVLQAFLRYVMAAEHGVKKEDRCLIYDDFKKLIYSDTVEEYDEQFKKMLSSDLWQRNQTVLKHLNNDLHPRAEEWALCHRKHLLLRGNNTTNYTEATFRVLKDLIFQRLKAFNLVQLFDFFVSKVELYYQSRIASVLNNRVRVRQTSKHRAPKAEKLIPLSAVEIKAGQIYEVSNSKTKGVYTVDMDLEICSCKSGFSGAPCKHQFKVAQDFHLSSAQFHETLGTEDKKIYHMIMVGSVDVPEDWYRSLHDGPQSGGSDINDDGDLATITDTQQDPSDYSVLDPSSTSDAPNENDKGLTSTTQQDLSDNSSTQEAASTSNDSVEAWSTRLRALCDKLSVKLCDRPDVYLPGVKALVTFLENKFAKESETALISALVSIKHQLRTGKRIKIQPTAAGRRVVGLRRCQQTGRTPNAARVQEHGYGRQQSYGPMHPIPSKKTRHVALHSLSARVDALRT